MAIDKESVRRETLVEVRHINHEWVADQGVADQGVVDQGVVDQGAPLDFFNFSRGRP